MSKEKSRACSKMTKQQLDKIRWKVLQGIYYVALNNGYDLDVFEDFSQEQVRIFDELEKEMVSGLIKNKRSTRI